MKKLKQTKKPIEQSFNKVLNADPYEIIYADPRNEEIHLQILNKVQLNAQMARWFLDLEYNQLLWSDGVYEILEIDSKRSVASYDTFLNCIHPEDRSIKEETQKALGSSKIPFKPVNQKIGSVVNSITKNFKSIIKQKELTLKIAIGEEIEVSLIPICLILSFKI